MRKLRVKAKIAVLEFRSSHCDVSSSIHASPSMICVSFLEIDDLSHDTRRVVQLKFPADRYRKTTSKSFYPRGHLDHESSHGCKPAAFTSENLDGE